MSTAEISTPDGQKLQLNIPDGATPETIHSAALAASQHYVQQMKPTMNPPGFMAGLKMAGRAFLGGSSMDQTNEMAQAGADKTAEDIATSKLGQQFPNIGAGIGTVTAMAPVLASLAVGVPEAKVAAESGDLGMAGRIVSGPGRAEAGSAIGTAEKAVGVNNDVVPTLKDVSSNLGLKTANTKQYMNALLERLKSGEELGPQALSQHHKMISEILSKENSGIAAKLGIISPRSIGGPAVAQASRINKMLVERLNEVTPGRVDAAMNYAAAMKRMNLYKTVAGAAAAYAGGNPLIKALLKSSSGE